MRYSSRFFLYGPFSLFVIFALGTMGWWWFAAQALTKKLDALNGHEIARGVRISFSSREITGFPFRLDTVIRNLRVTFPASHGTAYWQAENFASHSLIYDSHQALLEAAGVQTIGWIDSANRPQRLSFTPASLHASTILSEQALARFDLDIVGLNLPRFGAARAQFHIRRDPANDALDIALSADDLRLHAAEPAALGNRIFHAELQGRLSEAHLLAPIFGGQGPWLDYAERWRAQGVGAVDNLALDWGKLSVKGRGALALDPQRRPRGLLRLDVSHYQKLLNAAFGDAADQGFGAALLAAVSSGPPDKNSLPVTLAIKDGVAFVGSVPATTVDPLY